MTPDEVDVEALPHQLAIASDVQHEVCVLEGGLGSGKTITALLKMLLFAAMFPGVAILWIEPTQDLIGTIVLPKAYRFLSAWGVPHQYRTTYRGLPKVLLLWPGTRWETPVYLRSGDRPERISGFDVGLILVDEADQMEMEIWARAAGRLRDNRVERMGGIMQMCAFLTPEPGFRWTSTLFHERRTDKMLVIDDVSTMANTKNPKSYYETLVSTHEGAELERVTRGRRSSREGLVYRRFTDANVGTIDDPWKGEVELWCDFNGTKMAWAWVSLQRGRAFVFDELVREDTDTDEQAAEAARFAALHLSALRANRPVAEIEAMPPSTWPVSPLEAARRITVTGDAAGDYDRGAGNKVSYELIRQRGFTTRYGASNPNVEDTILTVNMALADGWLVIDKARAPYIYRCLTQQPRGPDGKPLKGQGSREKVKAGLDHGADVVRYGVWRHRPVYHRRGNQER